MAYQARRSKLFKEEFELIDENGEIAKTLYVELNPMTVAQQLSEKYLALQRSLTSVKEAQKEENGKTYETVEMAMKDILETVFGDEDTKTIIEFYDGRYLEMCREILPFVKDVVVPKVRELAQEERKNIISGYSRKKRRLLGKRFV